MATYREQIPEKSTAFDQKRVFTSYTTVKTHPDQELAKFKEERLQLQSVPGCNVGDNYDYNQVGLLNSDNVFAERVTQLLQGKSSSEEKVIVRKIRDNSGYITASIEPLGFRNESKVNIDTCYVPKGVFWKRGAK